MNANKYKVGDIVRYAPGWYSPGEEKYFFKVLEVRDYRDIFGTYRYIIGCLNTSLYLGSTEQVDEEMIEMALEKKAYM